MLYHTLAIIIDHINKKEFKIWLFIFACLISFAGSRKSSTLKDVEAEYIKNLQQQIYFLELEAEYLREQSKKATDIHPKLTKEADRMMFKLKVLKFIILHYTF